MCWPALSISAHAERRVALVIGNAAYTDAGRLANPRNDAQDLGAALSRLGFDVTVEADVGSLQFEQTVAGFVAKARGADVALFFYAGHALQLGSVNYLIPVDAKLAGELAVKREAISAQDVVELMEGAAKTNLVFLDACRNNPLADRLRAQMQSSGRSANVGRGLGRIDARGRDTLIVFSAEPGQEAVDTVGGRNSPFAAGLLSHMETPDIEIETMLKRVTAEVARTTAHKQQPERLSKLISEFYFKRRIADAAPLLPAPAGPSPQRPPIEPTSVTIRATLGKTMVDGKERGRLGVAIDDLGPEMSVLFGEGLKRGVLITRVDADGPAAGSGLQPLDLATEIEGAIPESARHLPKLISDGAPGHTVELRVRRLAESTNAALQGLRQLAEGSNAAAQLLLAWLQAEGHVISKDATQAVYWYRKAAEGGNALAMNNLGAMFTGNRGLAKNEAEEMRWYRKAADAGLVEGMENLAWMLATRGGPQDEAEAVRLFQKVAERGHPSALVTLSALLESGLNKDIERNSKAAARWFLRALRAGDSTAHDEMRASTAPWSAEFRRELQRLMKEDGFYSGPINGNIGAAAFRAALDKLKPPKQ